MRKINPWILFLFILLSEILGSLGSIVTTPSIPVWYKGLAKPPLTPPNWIFAPVWTLLFALMGMAAYFVWREGIKRKNVRTAIYWFAIQFAFNILWSFLFFGLRSPIAGLGCILIFLVCIIFTMRAFLKVYKVAGYLLLPYILWVSFAAYLNAAIFFLN